MPVKNKKQSELLLPRGYLSPSALVLFESSEKRYIEKYFYGHDDDRQNDFMSFGKRFALAKETGDCQGDLMLEFAVNVVPAYKLPEYKIEGVLKTPYGLINLLCIPDSFDDDFCKSIEYKTGKFPWTQARVQKHPQLHFCSVATKAKYGLNPEHTLWWIETTDRDEQGNKLEKVRPTGKVESFYFQASEVQLLEMERRITRACLSIDKLYREHLNLIK